MASNSYSSNKGFSLVELAIVVAVMAILTTVALPSMREFLANVQIRTASEALKNGLQLARAEAVRRNTNVRFVLNANGGSGWAVGCVVAVGDNNADGVDDCPAMIQTRDGNEGGVRGVSSPASQDLILSVVPVGATTVTFNGLGRVVANAPATPSITRIDIDSNKVPAAATTDLRLVILGSSVTTCLPSFSVVGDPRKCP